MMSNNIFNHLPLLTESEEFETLLQQGHVKIERIVSSSHPDDTLQCQTHDEWVLLMQGAAILELNGNAQSLTLGDYLFIPAGAPHRVVSTDSEPPCIWLAIHIDPSEL